MSNERASVKIYSDAKNNLAVLAKRSGKSEIDYLSKGIDFIYQSGIDVYGLKDLIPKMGQNSDSIF